MLLSNLRDDDLATLWAEKRRVRVPQVLGAEDARHLAADLNARSNWSLTMSMGGRNARIPPETWAAAPDDEKRGIIGQLHAEAASGRGFWYEGIVIDEGTDGPAGELYRQLSSRETFAAIEALTGHAVSSVSAQATRYRPGHYLTRHRDDPRGETRKLAYVLSVTEAWHPDWGGLLQFFEPDGTPLEAWAPGFGVLSLFDVTHVHSVTYVAPWAKAPRLSVTGWFSA